MTLIETLKHILLLPITVPRSIALGIIRRVRAVNAWLAPIIVTTTKLLTIGIVTIAILLGFLIIGGIWGFLTFILGLGFLAILTMLLGNVMGLRDLVFSLATHNHDRFILYETPAAYELCPVREHTDTQRYDYEYRHDGEWHGFEDKPERWHDWNGKKLGLLWEKNQDVLEDSAATKNWIKDKEYVIDASKELGVLREAGDPSVIQRVREVVLKRETADAGESLPMQFLISIGGIVVGALVGFVLVIIG